MSTAHSKEMTTYQLIIISRQCTDSVSCCDIYLSQSILSQKHGKCLNHRTCAILELEIMCVQKHC